MVVLVANAGSSSLKLRVVGAADELLAAADLRAPDPAGDLSGIERFVEGSPDFEAFGDLAPLHNGPALAVLDALRELRPELPHVACFDTAFHAALPDAADADLSAADARTRVLLVHAREELQIARAVRALLGS